MNFLMALEPESFQLVGSNPDSLGSAGEGSRLGGGGGGG